MMDVISEVLEEILENCNKCVGKQEHYEICHSYPSLLLNQEVESPENLTVERKLLREFSEIEKLKSSSTTEDDGDDQWSNEAKNYNLIPEVNSNKDLIIKTSVMISDSTSDNNSCPELMTISEINDAGNPTLCNNTSTPVSIKQVNSLENKTRDEELKQSDNLISYSPLSLTFDSDSDSEILTEVANHSNQVDPEPEVHRVPYSSNNLIKNSSAGIHSLNIIAHKLCGISNMQNTSEESIDLLSQCKNDYSAETPVVATNINDLKEKALNCTQSLGIPTSPRESEKHNLSGPFDKNGMIFTSSPNSGTSLAEVKFSEPEFEREIVNNENVSVYEKQEIEAVVDKTRLNELFNGDMYDYDNSIRNKSIDTNNGSLCSHTKPIPLEDCQFKYMLDERDEMNISDKVPVNNRLPHFHVIQQNDMDIDIISSPQLDECKMSDRSDLLGKRLGILDKSNVIRHYIEPTVGNEKMKINDVLASYEGCVGNQLENNNHIECTEKLTESPEEEEHAYRKKILNRKGEHAVKPTSEYENSPKDLRLTDEEREDGVDSFEIIEDMYDIKSSSDSLSCAQPEIAVVNPDYINLDLSTPDPTCDHSEDYPPFPTTQCFKPTAELNTKLYTQHVGGADRQTHIPDFQDNYYEFEEEAVVPASVCKIKRNISHVYSEDEELDVSKGMLKRDYGELPISTCFKWNSAYTNMDYSKDTITPQPEIGNGFTKPLLTCTRPIRLGLSKKQKTKTLHPSLR